MCPMVSSKAASSLLLALLTNKHKKGVYGNPEQQETRYLLSQLQLAIIIIRCMCTFILGLCSSHPLCVAVRMVVKNLQ